MSIASSLLTAAEFAGMPDPGHPQELVRGMVVNMPPPKPIHGLVCGNVYFHLRVFAESRGLGRAFCNDTGVVTEADPDTVRGPDVFFMSYAKVPAERLPPSYFTTPPDSIFEVFSPSDRWSDVHQKVTEYLQLGVPAVYVLDPQASTDPKAVHCYYPDRPQEILGADDELMGVGVLSGFQIRVSKLFE
jgi:Uma2 family endonuclease